MAGVGRRRRYPSAFAGLCVALATSLSVPAPTDAQQRTRECGRTATGLIAERWMLLDGPEGPLGCPTTGEIAAGDGANVRQLFEHGEIATSAPKQGDKMVVAAYQDADNVIFNWGDTAPYHYDKFILRWSYNGKHAAQKDVDSYIGRRDGFYTLPDPRPGIYSFIVEGCDTNAGGSTCRQKWTVPVQVAYEPPPLPRYPHCDPSTRPAGEIAVGWAWAGGGDGYLGCPTGAVQPVSGRRGSLATFEGGSVVWSPDQGDRMTVAAFQRWDKLAVEWGVTEPYGYDKFIVRWDRNGRNVGQEDVNVGGDGGSWEKKVPPGNYTVVVEGCDRRGIPKRSVCKQGFTIPAPVTIGADPRGTRVPLPDLSLAPWKTPRSVDEANAFKAGKAFKAARHLGCLHRLNEVFKDEDNFMYASISRLYIADDWRRQRRDVDRDGIADGDVDADGDGHVDKLCPGNRFDPVTEVNDAIRRQKIKSRSGTDSDACGRTGEYDVALKGYVRLIYRYPHLLAPDVRYRIHRLLNKTGPHDKADDLVCGTSETENHRLLIESSRYLTNQLRARTSDKKEFDNARNGMDEYMLRWLRLFLQNDFVEYNSRPYQNYTWAGIQNLADFAENPDVKLAAQMVLDYVAAKVAVSTNDLRRHVPYRRKRDYNDPALFGRESDPMKNAFMIYAAPTPPMDELKPRNEIPVGARTEMVMLAATNYEPPAIVLDLLVNPASRSFFQRIGHAGVELYSSEPDFLIVGGGIETRPAYKAGPFFMGDDRGAIQPTYIMPTGKFTNVNQMIRFPRSDEEDGANVCVAPGFACGFDVEIPASYLPAGSPQCWRRESTATFIDANSPGCREGVGDGFGFYLVAFKGTKGFGFFEAVPKHKLGGVSLDDFVRRTKERNQGRKYGVKRVNEYTAWDGQTIRFDVRRDHPVISTGFPAFDGLPGALNEWPLAQGSVISSAGGRNGIVTIRNLHGARLELDFRKWDDPKRFEFGAG